MEKCNSIKGDFNKTPNIYPNLNADIASEQQFRQNKINEITDFSKYIAFLDYFHKSLNALSILSGSISIATFATVIGAPAGIIEASCGFTFSITSGFLKKFLKTIRNKKKKHNKIVMPARNKLNSIESKISKALMDNEISHEDFETIINEEKKIENWNKELEWWIVKKSDAEKVSLIEEGKKQVLMKLSSVMKLLITV